MRSGWSKTATHCGSCTASDRITLVDSNVLLDIVTDDPTWSAWSSAALAEAFDNGRVVLNPTVYAEVSVGFDHIENLDEALPADQFIREPLPYAAGFVAGKALRCTPLSEARRWPDVPGVPCGHDERLGAWPEQRSANHDVTSRGPGPL